MSIITPDIKEIINRLSNNGYQTRIAGGAVRDSVMGIEPKDIDLATTALPQEVIDTFEDVKDYSVIPTGLQHGTITVVKNKIPYEITTLRIDQETDGRHAIVEYTTDWELDAARRDFTMNAMCMDEDGNIYDYHGGQQDIHNRVVKFVGNAEDRIKEDYLRILRFFRFRTRMAQIKEDLPKIGSDILSVIRDNAEGLQQISGERIWMELSKILPSKGMYDAVYSMMETGVFRNIGLTDFNPYSMSQASRISSNPITILCAGDRHREGFGDFLAEKFKVSRAERELANWLTQKYDGRDNNRVMWSYREVLERSAVIHGRERVAEFMAMIGEKNRHDYIRKWDVPVFPVTGQDLIDTGMKPGPEIGNVLDGLKQTWIGSHFTLSREFLLNTL